MLLYLFLCQYMVCHKTSIQCPELWDYVTLNYVRQWTCKVISVLKRIKLVCWEIPREYLLGHIVAVLLKLWKSLENFFIKVDFLIVLNIEWLQIRRRSSQMPYSFKVRVYSNHSLCKGKYELSKGYKPTFPSNTFTDKSIALFRFTGISFSKITQ